MSMKITKLRTYWDAGEAENFIAFLDDLRDAMWDIYYDDIAEMHYLMKQRENELEKQLCFDFDDEWDNILF